VPGSRLKTAFAVFAAAIGLVLAFVAGLFIYVNATARPLHPDAQAMPSVARQAPPAKWAAAVHEARQALRAGVSAQNLPGLSVAVASGGEIVWAEAFGYADLEKHLPMTPETQLRAGGVSESLTSAAVGLLLDRQRLNLDHDIQEYVPNFPEKPWPITLRALMAGQSGIRNDGGDEEPIAVHCDRALDAMSRFANDKLLFEPGTRYRASSYGWILVSGAVEAASGEPFTAFMQRQVFDPLGMSATRMDSAKDVIPARTTFYYPRFAGDTRYGPELARDGDYSCLAGGAGFLSTPSDLVRFGAAFSGGTLLQRATVEALLTPQRLTSGDDTGYGLGWKIETVPLGGRRVLVASHGTRKDFLGGTASLLLLPERRIVVAVMSNTGFADTGTLASRIADFFSGL
jgi:CubicO group peptidase (beta-lactamase class C family)